ncbi:MAG: hypothetical protein QXK37_06165, partial [Candidatus Woesearchaeota archaeon]
MKAIFVAMFMTLLFGLRAHAATYWVSPNGQSLWKDCQAASPLNGIEACNLTVANANAVAGDTVFLREGIYNTYINPSNSGTSDTNRIVFTNFNGENVTIYNTSYGILLEDKSYVTVSGINCYYLEQFLVMKRSNHNIVSFCTFHLGRNLAQWTGSVINDNSQYNKVSNCIFWNFGKTGYESGDNDGAMLDIGTIESYSDNSFYNLIEGNHFYNCGHHCFAP